MTQSDLIIIGAGPGGYELAARRAAAGERVVIIEDRQVGGTCLNRGCIPTKCLCRSAEVLKTVREAEAFGVKAGEVNVDYSRAVARMNAVVDSLRQGVETLLKGCEVVEGRGEFTPEGHVRVGEREFSAPRIIIATGSKPAMLPIPGAELAMTSDELLAMETLPESMAIIGGGVIGLEFASIMNEFGVNVTVIEYCKEILPPFDKDVAKRLRSLLSRRGITFVTGSAVTSVTESENGPTVT
ncbi:MAG: FAD-dependent oxidoreductase, partial [Muribaculaceae bacterium]|nr:FAD-dependent oxidoreductase [Muribaculaceae bacterium]